MKASSQRCKEQEEADEEMEGRPSTIEEAEEPEQMSSTMKGAEGEGENPSAKTKAEKISAKKKGKAEKPPTKEAKEKKAMRATKKRPATAMEQEGMMSVKRCLFCRAITGKNPRAYLLAEVPSGKKCHILSLSKNESPKYETIMKDIHLATTQKIKEGVNFVDLKSWCALQKAKLA